MSTSTVADEFECHQKCLRNNSCKSFNVHPGADTAKRLCELNNKTRRIKPDDFIKKKDLLIMDKLRSDPLFEHKLSLFYKTVI